MAENTNQDLPEEYWSGILMSNSRHVIMLAISIVALFMMSSQVGLDSLKIFNQQWLYI